jgi:hypothetical protein
MAGQKINRPADAHAHRHAKRLVMHVDPLLLLRAAESNEEQIRLGRLDAPNDAFVIHLHERLKGRRIVPHDL